MASPVTGSLMKAGVLAAACVVVVRIILEQLGAPESVNNIFGVAWLSLVFAILFALRLAASGKPALSRHCSRPWCSSPVHPPHGHGYLLIPTSEVAGAEIRHADGRECRPVGSLQGLLVIPVRNALIWIVIATVVGMIIGGGVLFAKRKASPPSQA